MNEWSSVGVAPTSTILDKMGLIAPRKINYQIIY